MLPAQDIDVSDLGARFASVLDGLEGRSVSADALFDTLKLETIDWGIDQGIEATAVDLENAPVSAESAKDKA